MLSPRFLIGFMALAVAYYLGGRLGLTLAYFPPNATLFWPPTGMAVAVLVRGGMRYAPAVWLGAFATNLHENPWFTAAMIAFGNAAAPVVASALLRRFDFDRRFERPHDATIFLMWAVALAMMISALNGTIWLNLLGSVPDGGSLELFLVWWVGDAVGVLIFAPFLLAWDPKFGRRLRERGLAVNAVLSLVTLVLLCYLVFGPLFGQNPIRLAIAFLPVLAVCRSALLFRSLATLDVIILACAAVGGLDMGTYPLPWPNQHTGAILVSSYLTAVGMLTLVIAAVTAERDAAQRNLAASEAEYRAIVEDNPAMICRFRPEGSLTFANATYRKSFGSNQRQLFLARELGGECGRGRCRARRHRHGTHGLFSLHAR